MRILFPQEQLQGKAQLVHMHVIKNLVQILMLKQFLSQNISIIDTDIN